MRRSRRPCTRAPRARQAVGRAATSKAENESRCLLLWSCGGGSSLFHAFAPGEGRERRRGAAGRLQPAGGSSASQKVIERRLLDAAAVERVRAARMEAAARR